MKSLQPFVLKYILKKPHEMKSKRLHNKTVRRAVTVRVPFFSPTAWRATAVERQRYGNFFLTPTVYHLFHPNAWGSGTHVCAYRKWYVYIHIMYVHTYVPVFQNSA